MTARQRGGRGLQIDGEGRVIRRAETGSDSLSLKKNVIQDRKMPILGWEKGAAEGGRVAKQKVEKFYFLAASTKCISSIIIYYFLSTFYVPNTQAKLFRYISPLIFKTNQGSKHHYAHIMEVRKLVQNHLTSKWQK